MNTATASFNTTVRQITKMSQWPKCLSKKKFWSAIRQGGKINFTLNSSHCTQQHYANLEIIVFLQNLVTTFYTGCLACIVMAISMNMLRTHVQLLDPKQVTQEFLLNW